MEYPRNPRWNGGYDAVQFLEETLAPSYLAMAFKPGSGEGLLSHDYAGHGRAHLRSLLRQSGRIDQRFPK